MVIRLMFVLALLLFMMTVWTIRLVLGLVAHNDDEAVQSAIFLGMTLFTLASVLATELRGQRKE